MVSKRTGKGLVSKVETDAQGVTWFRHIWVSPPPPWKEGQKVVFQDDQHGNEYHFTFRE